MKKIGYVIIVVFACAWLIKEIAMPVTAALVYSNAYIKQAYECDTAMEASWYYTQDNSIPPESEVTQLLACHDYDKTRKVLLMSGLPEEYLAWLGLKGLELYQRSPEEYVRQHRFTKR